MKKLIDEGLGVNNFNDIGAVREPPLCNMLEKKCN